MRTFSVLIILTSLVVGCTPGSFDTASGYPSFPAAGSPAGGSSAATSTLEPKLVAHEIAAPREPAPRRDLVECWQCRR